MLKTRDFYLMKVFDVNGKYLGVIEDISIDFYLGTVKGYIISSFSFYKKKNYVEIEDVISIEDVMIIKRLLKFKGLRFKDIKYMDVINENNLMKGVLEDLIIDKKSFEIKGLVISSGVFDKMYKGKSIILIKYCTLCEKYILYNENQLISFKTMPHNIEVSSNEDEV